MTGYSSRAYMAALQKKYRAMLQNNASVAQPNTSSALSRPWGDTLPEDTKPSMLESIGSPTNPVGAIIDVLSRPVYGVGRYLDTIKEHAEDGFQPSDLTANWEGNLRGIREVFAPENRQLPSEVLLENWKIDNETSTPEKIGRFAAGLGLDIATDPLTYVGAGAIRAAGRAVPGAATLGRKLRAGQEALPKRPLPPRVVEEAPEVIEDAAKTAPAPVEVPQVEGPLQITPPPPKPSVLLLEAGPIGKRTQAIRAAQDAENAAAKVAERNIRTADKISDGSFVYTAGKTGVEKTPNRAINWAVDSAGVASKQPARYRVLENTMTGEQRAFSKNLLNLQRSQKKYPGVSEEDFPTLFREAPVSISDDAVDAAMAKSAFKTERTGKPYTYEEWYNIASNSSATVTLGTGNKYKISVLGQLAKRAANSKQAQDIQETLARAYQDYIRKYDAERGRVLADLLRSEEASRDLARAARKADRARPLRLQGEELAAAVEEIKKVVSAEDAKVILSKKTPETYAAAVKSVLSQKEKVPTFIERVIDSGAPRPFSAQLADILTDPKPIVAAGATPKTKSGFKAKDILDKASQDIKPASQIIDEAVPGASRGPEAVNLAKGIEIDDTSAIALMAALGPDGQQWAERAAGFNWTTLRQHTARNSPTPGQGIAVNRESFNTMAQGNAWRVMLTQASREASQTGLTGLKRSEWIMSPDGFDLLSKIKNYEKFLRLNGAEPIISKTKQGWPLGLGDVLDVLYNQAGNTGRNFVQRRILSTVGISARKQKGVKGTIEPTALLEAVRVIMDSIDPNWTKIDVLESNVQALLARAAKGDQVIRGDLIDVLQGERGIATFTHNAGNVAVEPAHAAQVLQEAMQAVFNEQAIRGFIQAAHVNAANATVQTVDTVRQLTQETMTRIVTILNDRAASIGDAVTAVNKVDEGVKLSAVQNSMHVSEDAAKIAVQHTKDEIPTFVRMADVDAIDHLTKATRAAAAGDKAGVAATQLKHTKQVVADALEEVPPEALDDAAHVAEVALQAGLFSKMAPIKSKLNEFFIAHHGNATLHESITRGESVMRNMQGAWRRELNWVNHLVRTGKVVRKNMAGEDVGNLIVKQEHIVEAMKFLQGRLPNPSPSAQLVIERLRPAVENIFETGQGKAAGIFGAMFREGFDPAHLASKMQNARYGLKDSYRLDLKAATHNGKIDIEELANQWKNWDIDDPLDFMARMQTLAGSLQLDMSVANEAYRLANSLGYASRTKRVGFVKFPDQAESVVGRYMPPGVWIDPEILKEIRRMDDILSQSENFSSPFGQFVNKYLDPILNTWKSGVTVWNPGHHVRNFIGDSALSFLADGVKNPKYYTRAVDIQRLRSKYTTWDAISALRGTNRVPLGERAVVARTKNGLEITEDQLFNGMMDRGALPSAAVSEDLLESMASPSIAAIQEKMAITGGRAKKFVGRVSEGRDDTVRLAHAMHIIEHESFKSIDEALDAAARQVRKWHPDGLGLSTQERQIMRRIFPFYSWTRKTLPLVVESMVLHPGRVLLYPKASYNFAQGQGIDLNSMSDPFPEDQLFPSYFRNDVLGPQFQDEEGEFHGVNPGFPTVDLLNEFVPDFSNTATGSDFLRELLGGPVGMLSPLIKSPIEAVSGTRMDTGSKVADLGEYFDSQVPIVNKVSSITGISPIGTVARALPGGEAGVDFRRSVEKEARDPYFSIEALINYLTGVGSRDMSTPTAINQAEIELRNRIGRQRET